MSDPDDDAGRPTPGRPPAVSRGAGALGTGLPDRHSDIFFAAVETTCMPMIVTDPRRPDNPIVFSNRAFSHMTGYSRDEIIGRNCRFLQGPDTDRDTVAQVRDAIAENREIAVEILNYRKNGVAFWNAVFISPVWDDAGEVVYFFGSQLDVSRRRDAEDALRQSQKMEALGQLTGGIAHDFNNLLQVVSGYTEILEGQLARLAEPPAKMSRAVAQIRAAADRASTLTQQLLAFARKQRLEGRVVSLNELVQTLSDMARHTLGDSITVDMKLAPDLWNARLDAVQAEVALLNILINARDAMPGGGRVTIETRNREIAPGDEPAFDNVPAGRYAAIAITDDGVGMPPEVARRVMDPFFTTKEEGKGTGLGLSMVYGFMRQSGGAARIYSEVGRGTTVRLYFPATSEDAGPEPPRPRARTGARGRDDHGGSETILVVDDRSEVADLAESILTDLGYRVLRAGNAEEALAVLGEAEHVDLLFSDLIMPGGMNGVMLAREARRRRPSLEVLLTTGYAEASLERRDAGGTEFEILDKPYRRSELARRVRRVLDGRTEAG